jgi:hypothetical protein
MSATVTALGCPIRELLTNAYRRMLSHYNQSLSGLLDKMPVEAAGKELVGLFDACVEARKKLADHEREHGCIPEDGKTPVTHR